MNWFHQIFLTAAKHGVSVKQIKLNECNYNFVKRCLVLYSLHKILLFMANWEECHLKLFVILLLYEGQSKSSWTLLIALASFEWL